MKENRGSKLNRFLGNSPWIGISLLTSAWSFIRDLLYQWQIGSWRPSPFDLPFLTSSPVATEYDMGFTLTLFTLLGVLAAIIGICRKREVLRYWGAVTLPLNLLAYWWATSQIEWAFNPPPGVDY